MADRGRSIGWKIALLGLVVFIGMGIVQFIALGFSADASFGGIEDRISMDHVQRTILAVAAEKDSLLDLVREIAAWDDMYDLVGAGSGESLPELLSPVWMELSGLDLIILLGSDGRTLWSGLRSDPVSLLEPVVPGDLPPLGIGLPLPDPGLTAIVKTDRGPLVFGALPVNDTAFLEPGLGALVFGRYLARAPLARIADHIQLSTVMGSPADLSGRRLEDRAGDPFFVRDESDLRTLLVPIEESSDGLPVTLRLAYHRSTVPAVARLLLGAGLAYMATVILALSAAFVSVRRLALLPVLRVTRHLDAVSGGQVCEPLRLGAAKGRMDEIGVLADHVDRLIETERQRKEELAAVNRELERRASTDALTGLANRRFFAERLEREKRRILRGLRGVDRNEMAFVVCDIDFFKLYNDRYGHSAGDACLRVVAEAIQGALSRPTDFACRQGGEEFLVMLPGTDLEGGRHVAERIRATVESLALPHEDSKVAPCVTLSLGVAASIVDENFDHDLLFRRADEALYRAKAGGRNRAEAAADVVAKAPESQA